jgi:hypothetical protein
MFIFTLIMNNTLIHFTVNLKNNKMNRAPDENFLRPIAKKRKRKMITFLQYLLNEYEKTKSSQLIPF